MTVQTLETIRKYLVTARVSRPEEDEFFRALAELDRLIHKVKAPQKQAA
jgi:hypothetical protein